MGWGPTNVCDFLQRNLVPPLKTAYALGEVGWGSTIHVHVHVNNAHKTHKSHVYSCASNGCDLWLLSLWGGVCVRADQWSSYVTCSSNALHRCIRLAWEVGLQWGAALMFMYMCSVQHQWCSYVTCSSSALNRCRLTWVGWGSNFHVHVHINVAHASHVLPTGVHVG